MDFRRKLLLLTVAAFLVRAAFLLLEPPTGPVADERTWTNWAIEGLVTPRVHFDPFRIRMIFHPPLYPYFIGALYACFGTLNAVKWAQALAGALVVTSIGSVGRRAFGPRVGLVGAAVAAFYPELVWFSVHFWAETLFMAFLWWGFERLLEADESGGFGAALAAGVLWGLAILTRETVLYFLPAAALWLAWRQRRCGAVFLVAALLVVAPWTYRNWAVFHAFVPVSTAGGLNLYQGNAPLSRQQVYDRYEAVHGRIEQYKWARAQGLQAIRDRQPWWIFEKLRDEMPNYWEADSQAIIHVKRGAYGPVRPGFAVAVALSVLTPYLVLLGFFVAGAASFVWERRGALLVLFLIYYNMIHVATHGYARYRLPSLPVVVLVAVSAFAAWRAGRFPALSVGRRAVAVALCMALIACLAPSVRLNLEDPAFGAGREDAPVEQAPEP
jgi:4-amino-4-deoxy-L-arabinose transferase-like glycosyltransferase